MLGNFQFFLSLRNSFLLCFAGVSMCACSSMERIDISGSGSVHEAIEAATGPLQDLNLRRQEIPPLLKTAAINPYARPTKASCATVRDEMAQLTDLLGPDMEPVNVEYVNEQGLVESVQSIELPDQDGMVDGASSLVHDTILSTIASHTNIIPFRGIVRKITGADRHQRKVERAYEAGKLRRAYLKGYAQEHFGIDCLKPRVIEAKANVLEPLPLPEPASGAAF